ncbi:predicted protein [Uncinocarpus reesii 1704]|uniref:Isoindolinone tripeptide biosynthesis cluster protein B n=1 Tax=Uncinocarpus reesii (strain UAMH 1704) TaxID=336963 RepID=UNCB_UNCRE|nr:uncharacterized protein UREG_02295 [Uncinocarpus reesii 1704]EEP77446.1 predicted protein [Uncinocarpus reesii 1704]
MSDGNSSLAYRRSVASFSSSLSEMSVDPGYVPDFSVGMRAEVQQLYRPDDRSPWNESVPEKAATDVEAGSYAQECALIVRREPHPITKQIALHSITVQSPLIKKVLDRTFKGLEGVNTQLKQLTFQAPFHIFYYRWHRFEKLCEDEQDQEAKNHLDILYPILSEEVMPHVETMKDLTRNKVITFDYLWTIFAPGMEVYTRFDGQDRLMELTDSRYGANMGGEFFTLELRYIDCDGSSFGYVSSSVDIDKFQGVKKLVDLDAFPAHLHPDMENVVDRLHARGAKLEKLNGFCHMSYSGFYTAKSSRQIRKRHGSGKVENSRIIIDPHTFNLYGTPGPGLGSIGSELDSHADAADEEVFAVIQNVIYRATSQAFQAYQRALERLEKRSKEGISGGCNTASDLFTCSRTMFDTSTSQNPEYEASLALQSSRPWLLPGFQDVGLNPSLAEFYVENVYPIRWNENAFQRLVLPPGYKEIIRAFVQEQLSRDDDFDDIIYGKGRECRPGWRLLVVKQSVNASSTGLGFIMLLSGEPGVGKTLTAESVAEEMRQPLYLMSASELGETATEVEESLEQVLELTSKWNAILLLDECDMFLEARSTADLRRNRLVSGEFRIMTKRKPPENAAS